MVPPQDRLRFLLLAASVAALPSRLQRSSKVARSRLTTPSERRAQPAGFCLARAEQPAVEDRLAGPAAQQEPMDRKAQMAPPARPSIHRTVPAAESSAIRKCEIPLSRRILLSRRRTAGAPVWGTTS